MTKRFSDRRSSISSIPINAEAEEDVENLIDQIIRIHTILSQTPDLRPSPSVNAIFGRLVDLCTQTLNESQNKLILENQRISDITSSLRTLCATAECHLEAHWADLIIGSGDAAEVYARLTEFPYYENYVDLTKLELSVIKGVSTSPPQRIAFIGSGPLPLTSLLLCQTIEDRRQKLPELQMDRGPIVINIDHDPRAISQSSALCRNLGERAKGMQMICQEASSSDFYFREFDVVYLAALVGMTQREKEDIVTKVAAKMQIGSLLVIRTVHSLRTLLYPRFDVATPAILSCLDICMIVHPYNHIVNSVIIGRVKTSGANDTRC